MALLLFDGFETGLNWRNGNNGGNIGVTTGRDGVGKALYSVNNNGNLNVPIPGTPGTSGIIGVAWKPNGGSLGIVGNGATVVHLSIDYDANGKMQLKRGTTSGTIIANSSTYVDRLAWHYYEIKYNVADSGGSCVIKEDGVTVINYTGDTRNGGLGTVDTFNWGGYIANPAIDDLYILDLTGPAPYNDFIGERIVKAMRPTGPGALTALTPSAGANWDCLNEDPWTTTDSVSGSTGTDTYAHSDVAGYAIIDAVQVATYALKSDTGVRTMRTVQRSAGGTVVESPDLALSVSATVVQGPLRQTDPDGAAWTQAVVNSSEYGVKVT